MKIFRLNKVSGAIAVFAALAGIGLIAQATWTPATKGSPNGSPIAKSAIRTSLNMPAAAAGTVQTAGPSPENSISTGGVPVSQGTFESRQRNINGSDNPNEMPDTTVFGGATGNPAFSGSRLVESGIPGGLYNLASSANSTPAAVTQNTTNVATTAIPTTLGGNKDTVSSATDSARIDLDAATGSYRFNSGVDTAGDSTGTARNIGKKVEKETVETTSIIGDSAPSGNSIPAVPVGSSPQEILKETAATKGKLYADGKTQTLPSVKQLTLTAMVPEPTTLALLGLAIVGFITIRRRKSKKH